MRERIYVVALAFASACARGEGGKGEYRMLADSGGPGAKNDTAAPAALRPLPEEQGDRPPGMLDDDSAQTQPPDTASLRPLPTEAREPATRLPATKRP